MTILDTMRVIGPPQTNRVMTTELNRISKRVTRKATAKPRAAGNATIVLPWDDAIATAAIDYHRTSTRVLRDLYETDAGTLEALYTALRADLADDERDWRHNITTISVTARNVGAFAAGERQIVGTVKNALIDDAEARGLNWRVDTEQADAHIMVRMHDNTVSVSLDPMHTSQSHRGYRIVNVDAPMREPLAAAVVMLSTWDNRHQLLVDPMCGSGTIAIEAALLARGAARVPDREPLWPNASVHIMASDADNHCVQASQRNAAAARVDDAIELRWADVRKLEPRSLLEQARERGLASGIVVTNPPYGERVGRQVDSLTRELGDWARRLPGWKMAVITGDSEFEQDFGLRPRVVKPMRNGSIPVRFLLFDL